MLLISEIFITSDFSTGLWNCIPQFGSPILYFVFSIAVIRSFDMQVVCLSCLVFVLVLNQIVIKYIGCFVVSLPVHEFECV